MAKTRVGDNLEVDTRSPAGSQLEPPRQAEDHPEGSGGNPTRPEAPGKNGNVVIDTRGAGKIYLGDTKPDEGEEKGPHAREPWMSTRDTGPYEGRGQDETDEPAGVERNLREPKEESSVGNSSGPSTERPETSDEPNQDNPPQPVRVTERPSKRGRDVSSTADSADTSGEAGK